jgi:hypothetical protein
VTRLSHAATVGLNRGAGLGYGATMRAANLHSRKLLVAVTPSPRTRRAELLRLCARIGYSPPADL